MFSQSPPSNFRLCFYTSNNSLIKIFHFDPRPVIIQYDNVNSGCTYYLYTSERPHHTNYAIESIRIISFNNWPQFKHQTPQQLAEAGFFYAGN